MNDKQKAVQKLLWVGLIWVSIVFILGMSFIYYREGVRRRSQRIYDIESYVPFATTEKERILNMFRYAEWDYEEGDFIAEYDYTNVTDFYVPKYSIHVGFDAFDNLIYAVLPEAIPEDAVTKSTDGQTRDSLIQRGYKEVKYNGELAYIKEGLDFVP